MLSRTGSLAAVAAAALLVASPGAWAQKAGNLIGSIGVAYIMPNESAGPLNSVGPAAPLFNATTAGASVSIDNVATAAFSVLYMVTDNIAAEFTFGVPPKFTVDVNLPSSSHPGAATAKESTPALVGKYLFLTPADRWRPYLGLGVTYASFSSVSPNKSDPLVNALAGSSASLSSSWAPVYNAGVIYNIDDRWSVNASLSYIPLKTTATFVGTGTTTKGTLTLNPVDLVVKVGYKFF